jgi:NAD(P)H dehydrogenase (quinone)
MAKILILYDSATGRTQKMAQFVTAGVAKIPEHTIRLKSVNEASGEDVLWCDALAVGSPTNLGAVSWKMKKFWDDISSKLWGKIDGKIATVFSSAGSYGGGNEVTCLNMLIILINFGFLVFGVTDYAAPAFSPHYGAISATNPEGETEKAGCILLGERLAQWAAAYVDHQPHHHPRYESLDRSR